MGAQIHSKKALHIHFSINKEVDFGKGLYVVGNIQELGSWRVQNALKLSWNQGHYWTGDIFVPPSSLHKIIEYKYVIADWENPAEGAVEWEAGKTNRKINPDHAKGHAICENSWNMQKIKFNLFVPDGSELTAKYSVIGNCKELGGWKKPVELHCVPFDEPVETSFREKVQKLGVKSLFTQTIEVYRGKSKIHYYYVKQEKQVLIERHPGRKYELSSNKNAHPRCLETIQRTGDVQFYEVCDFQALNYSQITDQIFLGAYLKHQEDFQKLKKEGITSILSIQTDRDHNSHRLTPDYLSDMSQINGLHYYNYSIQDMNNKDFLEKWIGAVSLLRKIIADGERVYVHCSAGVYRSPQIVILYLMLIGNLTAVQAIELVKEKHPFARPNQQLICKALEDLSNKRWRTQTSNA